MLVEARITVLYKQNIGETVFKTITGGTQKVVALNRQQ